MGGDDQKARSNFFASFTCFPFALFLYRVSYVLSVCQASCTPHIMIFLELLSVRKRHVKYILTAPSGLETTQLPNSLGRYSRAQSVVAPITIQCKAIKV